MKECRSNRYNEHENVRSENIENDLGINQYYAKGQVINVRNCWHFCTDGNDIDALFYEEEDFIDGMNRVFIVHSKYRVTILAFVLMDNHLHFILHGGLRECYRFMQDYLNRTSKYISIKYHMTNKLDGVTLSHQKIDSDKYLMTAICYVIKNPPVAGIPYMSWNYPWSSGSLYFNRNNLWTSANWSESCWDNASRLTRTDIRQELKTRADNIDNVRINNGLVFPGEYVAANVVEAIFKTCKSFNYFLCTSKEEYVESRGGYLSKLTLPMQEMRQHKNELCEKIFGVKTTNTLDTAQRLKLAKTLKSKYNSSTKQIASLCGLVYDQVKSIL